MPVPIRQSGDTRHPAVITVSETDRKRFIALLPAPWARSAGHLMDRRRSYQLRVHGHKACQRRAAAGWLRRSSRTDPWSLFCAARQAARQEYQRGSADKEAEGEEGEERYR